MLPTQLVLGALLPPSRVCVPSMQLGMLPTRLAPNPEAPDVVVTGKSTGNIVFGKLQRAAQLPGTRLGSTPFASVDDRSQLSGLLWSSFAMASVASGCWLDRKELTSTSALDGALLFVDATAPEASGGLFGMFGKSGAAPAAPAIDAELLRFAAARGAIHAFVMCADDDAAVGAAVDACRDAISGLTNADGTPLDVDLRATVVAPVAGCALSSSAGWVADTTAQDHEGILSAPLNVQVGYSEAGGLEPTTGGARTLTLTLRGCADGIGVGVDSDNCVDLLTPGKPAAAGGLMLGDKLLDWDGVSIAGKKLREVVTADADKAAVRVERAGVPPVGAGTAVARSDFAELVVQCALRLARTADEGAPPVRVVRVAPADDELVERPLSAATYEGLFAGPKTRKRMGVVKSADWSSLLAPFGVVKKADPNDRRCLIDAKITETFRSPA